MSSLQLFADEVMPEFHAMEPEHAEWKLAVLAGDLALPELDTSIHKLRTNQTPTKVAS